MKAISGPFSSRAAFGLSRLRFRAMIGLLENLRSQARSPDDPSALMNDEKQTELATVGGGCFWCTEAVMERLEGVSDVVSGYMGGHVDRPTYQQVCSKSTGHAEVIQITFDPAVITYEEILDVFWQAHDPTTLNRQGADAGPQYRSVIFYHSPEQKAAAERSKAALDASGSYPDPAVTEISEAATFWVGEPEHQDFYRNNTEYGYCRAVIHPKLAKLGLA